LEGGGFTVWCPEFDIYTQGDSERECLDNLREAALLHIEELGSKKVLLPAIRYRTIELALP
jgi:predicted RNase H-like HicB family nuclease